MIFKNLLVVLFVLSAFCASACAQPAAKTASSPTTGGEVDWTKENAGTPKGKVAPFTVDDKQYNRKRKIWVYTPPGYDAKSPEPYRLLISFDGEDYVKDIPAPTIIDNLIAAGKIYPTVQIMVDNSQDRLG
ncbi:MAG TPA: alpha/beta hydrolase-fold protein, partial [Pyrinomonadaceae bacterium]|nr:alpha/beta hydrolase-fold protein [Pyrinomonadaceae bacterium]